VRSGACSIPRTMASSSSRCQDEGTTILEPHGAICSHTPLVLLVFANVLKTHSLHPSLFSHDKHHPCSSLASATGFCGVWTGGKGVACFRAGPARVGECGVTEVSASERPVTLHAHPDLYVQGPSWSPGHAASPGCCSSIGCSRPAEPSPRCRRKQGFPGNG